MNHKFIEVCHHCPHMGKPSPRGVAPCTLDGRGRDIIEHAREMDCPAGKFQLGLGDKIARVLYSPPLIRATTAVKQGIERVRGKPCGCDGPTGRRARLNKRFPAKRQQP